jgi:uncharacterized protein (DUF1501 family)
MAADPPTFSRRDFLRSGSLAAGVSLCNLPDAEASQSPRARSCILLMLIGGPSQLETWDPKSSAPAEVRGPSRPIATSVPGIQISEYLPRLASLAHRCAILRTVHHNAAPIHETGLQLLQTGRVSSLDDEAPHLGALAPGGRVVILPARLGNLGISISHGQGAGRLGADREPIAQSYFVHQLPHADRDRYGKTSFGDSCLQALRLVEQGTRCVVGNMFDTLQDRTTWDCHAAAHGLTSTLDDYRRTVCPMFDRACSALLDDLHQRGLLDDTLVVAMGEMGRTPHVNTRGGRDHWSGCWSIMMAGGGVRGGQVIGASDRIAAEPAERPVRCEEVAASIAFALGLPMPASPVRELFG